MRLTKPPRTEDALTRRSVLRVDEVLDLLQTYEADLVLKGTVGASADELARRAPEDEVIAEELVERGADRFEAALTSALSRQKFIDPRYPASLSTALAEVLLPLVNDAGDIDQRQVARALGPTGVSFLNGLLKIRDVATPRELADRSALHHLPVDLRRRVLEKAPSVWPELPALEMLLKHLVKKDELKGVSLVGVQHLLASTGSLLEAFFTAGVQPPDTRMVGKVYSTNHRVVAELDVRGVHVDPASVTTLGENFEATMKKAILAQLTATAETVRSALAARGVDPMALKRDPPAPGTVEPLAIVLDDGGVAIELLHEHFPELAPYFVCVEQTRRGSRAIRKLEAEGKLRCAVMNVGETWAKLVHESPAIAHSVCVEVSKTLDRLEHAGVSKPREVTVIGAGSIGRAVIESLLARGYQVHVYDDDPSKLSGLPPGATGHADKRAALGHAQMLISCVGERTFFPQDLSALPENAVLINAASSNDELGADELMSLEDGEALYIEERGAMWSVFDGKPLFLGQADADANHDIVLRTKQSKSVLLAKAGYVVNLTGDRDPIPPWHIQLTRALLFAAAISAFRIRTPGVHDLPRELQEAIVHVVEREFKKRGLDTHTPRFGAGGEERALQMVPAPRVPEGLMERLPHLIARTSP